MLKVNHSEGIFFGNREYQVDEILSRHNEDIYSEKEICLAQSLLDLCPYQILCLYPGLLFFRLFQNQMAFYSPLLTKRSFKDHHYNKYNNRTDSHLSIITSHMCLGYEFFTYHEKHGDSGTCQDIRGKFPIETMVLSHNPLGVF